MVEVQSGEGDAHVEIRAFRLDGPASQPLQAIRCA